MLCGTHYRGIKWVSRRLTSPTIRLLVQQLVHANVKVSTKALRYWPSARAIHRDRLIPTKRASNVDSISISWRHQANTCSPWWCAGGMFDNGVGSCEMYARTDSRFAPSKWEPGLFCNNVSHWLNASLESAMYAVVDGRIWRKWIK